MNQYTRYLTLKSAIENILGADAWYALKESNHLPTWKKQLIKVVRATDLSIQTSVEVYDSEWAIEINKVIELGKSNIKSSQDIEEAISATASTFINLSFLQTGLIPRRNGSNSKVLLKKDYWDLRRYRSVIYTQTNEQKERLASYNRKLEIAISNNSQKLT